MSEVHDLIFCMKCKIGVKHRHIPFCNGCYRRKDDIEDGYCSFCKLNLELGVAG